MLWGSGFTAVLKEDWGEGTAGLAPRAFKVRPMLRFQAFLGFSRGLKPLAPGHLQEGLQGDVRLRVSG